MSSGVSSLGYGFSSCCDDKFRSSSKLRFRDQCFSGVAAGENYTLLGRRSPPISAPAGRLVMTQSSLSTGNVVTSSNTGLYLDWSILLFCRLKFWSCDIHFIS